MFQLRPIFAIAPLALVAMTAAPAAAQYYPAPPPRYVGQAPGYRVMPEQELAALLRSLGFTPIGRPRVQGRLWIVRALDEDGTPMRVVVDATSGQIIDAIAIGPAAEPRPSYGMIPDDMDEPGPGYVPRPPMYRDYPPPPAARAYPGQGPGVIYRENREDYGDEPLPPGSIGPRSSKDTPQDKRVVSKPVDTNKRATIPAPKPRPTELSGTIAKDPTVTGSVPTATPAPKKAEQPLPPVNPLE